MIDADQVETLTPPIDLSCRLAEQFHPVQCDECFGHLFGAGMYLVVSITAHTLTGAFGPLSSTMHSAAGSPPPVTKSPVITARCGAIVRDPHSPTHLVERHEVAHVDIAELNDSQAFEGPWKHEHRNLDANDLKPQSFPGVSVNGRYK
jgi:hypothetical protein